MEARLDERKKKKQQNKDGRKETKENQKRKKMEVQAKPQQTKEEIKERDEEDIPSLRLHEPSPSTLPHHTSISLFWLFLLTLHQECVLPLAAADAVVSVAHVHAIV